MPPFSQMIIMKRPQAMACLQALSLVFAVRIWREQESMQILIIFITKNRKNKDSYDEKEIKEWQFGATRYLFFVIAVYFLSGIISSQYPSGSEMK